MINLQTALDVGTRLIEEGKLNGKDTRTIEEKVGKIKKRLLSELPDIDIKEFSKRNIAVEIYSDVLKSSVWLCSDNEMADQIQHDASENVVCYVASELQKLIELNPRKDFLKKIHDIKTVFNPSKLIE